MSTGAQEHRATAVRTALLDATIELLIERGADVTIEEIADRSGVGRRTIFRYFTSKDELIREATAGYFRALAAAVPARDGRDITDWLSEAARIVHEQNLRISPAFLPMVHRRREIPGISMFLDTPGRRRRHQLMESFAQEVWTARGGVGQVPVSIAESFTLHFSVFASEALRLHCRLDAVRMAELTVESVLALVDTHLADRSKPRHAKRRSRATPRG